MASSLPSRTDAIMPHPHEQKLQEVVNSLTCESFRLFVAALIVGTSRSPPSASAALPPTLALSHSLRLMDSVARGALCAGQEGDSSFLSVDIGRSRGFEDAGHVVQTRHGVLIDHPARLANDARKLAPCPQRFTWQN